MNTLSFTNVVILSLQSAYHTSVLLSAALPCSLGNKLLAFNSVAQRKGFFFPKNLQHCLFSQRNSSTEKSCLDTWICLLAYLWGMSSLPLYLSPFLNCLRVVPLVMVSLHTNFYSALIENDRQ